MSKTINSEHLAFGRLNLKQEPLIEHQHYEPGVLLDKKIMILLMRKGSTMWRTRCPSKKINTRPPSNPSSKLVEEFLGRPYLQKPKVMQDATLCSKLTPREILFIKDPAITFRPNRPKHYKQSTFP